MIMFRSCVCTSEYYSCVYISQDHSLAPSSSPFSRRFSFIMYRGMEQEETTG